VKIFYSPDTDSLSIKLRTGDDRVLGEIMGEELNENVILHRDDAGTLCEIEDIGSASKVFDLERLEVEGLPVNVPLAKSGQQESKAG
jgi:uncharacterized protein YuzE